VAAATAAATAAMVGAGAVKAAAAATAVAAAAAAAAPRGQRPALGPAGRRGGVRERFLAATGAAGPARCWRVPAIYILRICHAARCGGGACRGSRREASPACRRTAGPAFRTAGPAPYCCASIPFGPRRGAAGKRAGSPARPRNLRAQRARPPAAGVGSRQRNRTHTPAYVTEAGWVRSGSGSPAAERTMRAGWWRRRGVRGARRQIRRLGPRREASV
jgi:hypothetical protein